MTPLDLLLQKWRIAQVKPWVPADARVLDIGCAEGALFEQLGNRLASGLGLDPDLKESKTCGLYKLLPGGFPDGTPAGTEPFDIITMLAVLEHVPCDLQEDWARACHRLLKPNGMVLITVPSPLVDPILHLLSKLRLVHGMCLEQHYGFAAAKTPEIFRPHGFTLVRHQRFELGLNHFFAFRKTTQT